MANAAGVIGLLGAMYTTFANDYTQLENYAAAVKVKLFIGLTFEVSMEQNYY